ncbi:MAG: hypothetical protein AAF943_05795 [Pseudomonadota bacterium]
MVETKENFAKRLGKLGRKHERMTHGYSTKVGKDGLLIVTPRRRRFVPAGAGLKLLVLAAVGFFGFKCLALAAAGPVTYAERVAKLENGSIIEQIGAKALAVDPVTAAVADRIGPILR